MLPIQVSGGVENERLDRAGASGERRIGAHRNRGLVTLTRHDRSGHRSVAQHGEPGGVDAVGRDGRIHGWGHVGCREAHLGPPAIAAHHYAFNPVWTAQRFGGRHHVTGVHAGPDVGRRERHGLGVVVLGDQRHRLHREPEPRAGTAQRVDRSGSLLAEGEVLPHHDFHHMQVLDQQLVDVALRGELHEIGREGHDQKDVDAELLGKLGAPGQRGQLCGVAARVDHFHRVRVEGHQHRRHSPGTTRLDRVRDQFGVPAVQTVEHPDGEYASAPVRGYLVLPPPPLHNCQPTGQGSARSCESHRSDEDCLNFRCAP